MIPYPKKPPYGPCGPYKHRITKYYTIKVPPLFGMGKHYKNKKGEKKYLGHGFGRGYRFGKRVTLVQNRAMGAIKKPVIK